jgi:predicted nucleic acid-binding protein
VETYLLDTNVLIRFLRQDHPTMGPAARGLFQAAARGEVRLLLEESIVAEAVYVLQSVYRQSRSQIADALQALVRRAPAVQTERAAVLGDALNRYRQQTQVDFADALLAALAVAKQIPVASFDRDLDRFDDVTRFEPPTSAPLGDVQS